MSSQSPAAGSPAAEPGREGPGFHSLFVRIYATFVVSVLVFAALVGILVFSASSTWSDDRVDALVAQAEPHGRALAEAMIAEDTATLVRELETLERELDAHVAVLPHARGRRFDRPFPPPGPEAHRPPPPPIAEHPPTRAELRRLRQGQAIVRRHGLLPPTIAVPLFERGFGLSTELDDLGDEELLEPDSDHARALRRERGRLVALVTIDPAHSPRRRLLGLGALLLLALAGGAWPLARSLTARLARLERSTRTLADGDLSHRASLGRETPRDEIDMLAVAFNEMADRLETLVTGQRTLLANVSHELRTPIARTKVLIEILGERLEVIRDAREAGEVVDVDDIARLERGLGEMEEDLREVEALIRDLLTSGRLELGSGGALAHEAVDLPELCEAVAGRFEAKVACEPGVELRGDRLLLERLLRNLLSNARRACPDGELWIRARPDGEIVELEVEDEGPGVPADKRTAIFEPFARLDAARARDQGGVGLGLYLCRQIAQAHGGTIRAEGRRDGRSGARFVIRLGRG